LCLALNGMIPREAHGQLSGKAAVVTLSDKRHDLQVVMTQFDSALHTRTHK